MTGEDIKAIKTVAESLEAQGFFEKARGGDQRAASYFAKLVAYRANENGDEKKAGWLSKGGGHNIDGYAEDAICFGNDPSDLSNVLDLVRGAGAPGAAVIAEPKPRREVDRWVKPRPLTDFEMRYLVNDGVPVPRPTPAPAAVQFPPRNETKAAVVAFNNDYGRRGRRNRVVLSDEEPDPLYLDNEGLIVWSQQYLLYRVQGQTHQAAVDAVLRDIEAAWPK